MSDIDPAPWSAFCSRSWENRRFASSSVLISCVSYERVCTRKKL